MMLQTDTDSEGEIMGISTATVSRGYPCFRGYPDLAVFEAGAYIIFFCNFLRLGQEANGEGEVVLM